jgi:glycosyltransferase involved in cell wall biosynthesis
MGGPSDTVRLPEPADSAVAARPLRVTFVVTALEIGGAEMMLLKLLSRIDRRRFDPCVVVLNGGAAPLAPAFRSLAIPCDLLEWKPARLGDALRGMKQLARVLRARRPDVVQGWMYHANVAATLVSAFMRGRPPVLWNVRASLMDRRIEKKLTLFLIRLGGALSSSPARIINNSTASALEHERLMGYRADKRVILPNGFDVTLFRPSAEARCALRRSLGIADGARVVGMVARYHPMKDHAAFIKAAGLVARNHPDVHFVLAGRDVVPENEALVSTAREAGIADRVHLLGPRGDVHAIVPGFDIQVSSSSSGEGFPNVIGEAMSCGVPCVVTDVGDSAAVVGDTGIVVPPRDTGALAAGVLRLLALDAAALADLGRRARERTIEHYSLDAVVCRYQELFTRVHRESGGA